MMVQQPPGKPLFKQQPACLFPMMVGEGDPLPGERCNSEAGLQFLPFLTAIDGARKATDCDSSEPQWEMHGQASPRVWKYSPANGLSADTRLTPEIDGMRSSYPLHPGDLFRVVEERLGLDGVLFLRVEDNKGWMFDHKPGRGVMCIRQGSDEPLVSEQPTTADSSGCCSLDSSEPEAAAAEEQVATAMLKNIACKLSNEDVALILDRGGLLGRYTSICTPRAHMRPKLCNPGYVFVKFETAEDLELCQQLFNGKCFGHRNTNKKCEVVKAFTQDAQAQSRKKAFKPRAPAPDPACVPIAALATKARQAPCEREVPLPQEVGRPAWSEPMQIDVKALSFALLPSCSPFRPETIQPWDLSSRLYLQPELASVC